MFGLSFLSPLFLVGALAAAIPIAIHLFYRRTEPLVDFPATRYLRRAPVEQVRYRRLRELLLLALRVGAVVLLACAFARPFVSGSAVALEAPATVVLVDTSLSVAAPGQFAQVRDRAEEAVRTAPPDHAVAVLHFANGADVAAPLSMDRARAVAAVRGLRAGAAGTRYRAALRRAAEEMAGRPGRIVVVTDLQQTGLEAEDPGGVPGRIDVDVVEVQGPAANRAVTSLQVEGTEAVAIVRNFSPAAAEDDVVFTLDERRIGTARVSTEPGGSAEARLPLDGVAEGHLSASIADDEGYAADNVRHALVDGSDVISILAVTASGHPSESLYLERAVTIAEGAGGFRFRDAAGLTFAEMTPEELGRVDVVVMSGTRGLERRGRELLATYVRDGGGLLLIAGPDVDPAVLREALAGVVQTTWTGREAAALTVAPDDSRHPIFRPFGGAGTLGGVSFTRAALIEVPPGGEVIARYSDGSPALVEERMEGGRVLVFASDLNNRWNDLPIQPAFVPFVHETLRYLAAAPGGRSEFLVGELPGEAGRTPGVARLGPAGPRGRQVAVNVDPRESDPARMSVDAFGAGVSWRDNGAAQEARSVAHEEEDGQRLWQYALLLMIVSLAAEGVVGRRLG